MTPLETLCVVAVTVAVASLVSARLAVAAALVELALGVAVGAVLPVDAGAPWLVLVAAVAGVALTFVAGTEIDPAVLRRRPGPALLLGGAAFGGPFAAAFAVAHLGLGWSVTACLAAAAVLGETSLAVTYSVLLDLGAVGSDLGRLLMAAVFVTDVAAAAVMTLVIARPSAGLLLFGVGSAALCLALPRVLRLVSRLAGDRPSEPGMRVVVAALAALLLLAQLGGGVAVLPAFVLGVVAAGYYRDRKAEQARLRSLVMGFLAPFVFVRAGLSVSPAAVVAGAGAVVVLFAAKVLPKALGSALVLRSRGTIARGCVPGAAALMSTGLTFGTVINLAALQAGVVDRAQFSVLAAAVLLSAVVPGAVGQRLLAPALSRRASDRTTRSASRRISRRFPERGSVKPIAYSVGAPGADRPPRATGRPFSSSTPEGASASSPVV